MDEGTELLYYRVVLPTVKDRVPLPSHPFAWTMIAYVLWDGTFTDRMTPDQQQAMLDWLHWGGQLIISGPGSLDQLAGSFLAPYLPATSDGAVELAADALQPLNEYWSLTRSKLEYAIDARCRSRHRRWSACSCARTPMRRCWRGPVSWWWSGAWAVVASSSRRLD